MRNQVSTLMGCRSERRRAGRTSTAALIVAACLGLASATACTAAASPKQSAALQEPTTRTDPQINNAVEDMLLTDSALSNDPIDARTSEGIVTLTGTTDNLMAKERAAKLAETPAGSAVW